MVTRRTFVTHSAAASAALLPLATTAAPEPAPLTPVEAVRRHLTTDLDYELTLNVSFDLSVKDVPAHLATFANHPAPNGIYRREYSEWGRLTLQGAFTLYGTRWNGASHIRSAPADLYDFHRNNYQ